MVEYPSGQRALTVNQFCLQFVGSTPTSTTILCPYVPEIDRAVSAKDIYAGASPVADSNLNAELV